MRHHLDAGHLRVLIFGRPDIDESPATISPWLDSDFVPRDELMAMLDSQTHRRFIKTHTPLYGIPFYPDCTYITVYRDPRDVHFSLRNHATNLKTGLVNDERVAERANDDVGAGFRHWVNRPFVPEDSDGFALEALVHHFLSFQRYARLPNIHRFHYADTKRDLGATMRLVADILGLDISAPRMAALVEAAGFDNMKTKADQFAGHGLWKDPSRFFNKGTHRQWAGLDAEDLAIYDARMRALLPAEDIAWLQGGGAAQRLQPRETAFKPEWAHPDGICNQVTRGPKPEQN